MKRNKHRDDRTHDALRAIYQGDHRPDLRRIERGPRKRRRTVLLSVIVFFVVAAAVALAGFFLFTGGPEFASENIQLTISGAERVASGDDLAWTFTVRNNGKVTVTKVELTVRFPEDFRFLSADPEAANEFHNAWNLGTLKGGEQSDVVVAGQLVGDLDSTKTFVANVHYDPANFSSTFSKEAQLDVVLADSPLDVSIEAPTAVSDGQEVTYAVTVTNASDATLERVRLQLRMPDGLTDPAFDPEPTESPGTWDLADLDAGDAFTVTVVGTLHGDPEALTELRASAGVLDQQRVFRVQRERSALVLILAPKLNVTLAIASGSASLRVAPGGEINATLRYSNDSDSVVAGVELFLTFPGNDSSGATLAVLDEGSARASVPFTRSGERHELRWTKDQIPDLERLVPGASGTINLTLPVLGNLREAGSGKNFNIVLTAHGTAESIDETAASFSTASDAVTFAVSTVMRLAVEGRYYDAEGTPVGSGPMPPQVGQTTTYRIFWFVTNTTNGVKDVLLQAMVPEGATLVTGSAVTNGGNNITFDVASRSVRWRIDKVDAGVGQTLPTLEGYFDVSVTPTEEDLGTVLRLLNETTLTATDAFTGSPLTLTGSVVTTDLEHDSTAAGQGTVVAPPATNTNESA